MSLSLLNLADAISGKLHGTDGAINIVELSSNTRSLASNSAFVALSGSKLDGHDFVAEAFERGAAAAIVSNPKVLENRPGIVVDDTRAAAPLAASAVYANPQSQLSVVGVTGTNGKTTTNWMIYHLWRLLGVKSARIGTLGYESLKSRGDFGLTTPDLFSVHKLLAKFVSEGVTHVVMEVSSHALSQGRVDGIDFDAAVFTNLTQDHLDYHHDMQDYFEAKWLLFKKIIASSKKTKVSVVNSASAYGREILKRLKGESFLDFGSDKKNALCISNFEQNISGSRFDFITPYGKFKIESPFIGFHNAENLSAAVGVLCGLGSDPRAVSELAKALPQVPGRLELVKTRGRVESKFAVFVDYAHTPDALINVLRALRPLTSGRLSVIFGCGGDRDTGKRPLMRQVATDQADRVFVTSDNPRTEKPDAIITDIMAGAGASELSKLVVIPERSEAIRKAVSELDSGDVLLIAGKGHEEYQIVGDQKRHFSDVEEAKKALESKDVI